MASGGGGSAGAPCRTLWQHPASGGAAERSVAAALARPSFAACGDVSSWLWGFNRAALAANLALTGLTVRVSSKDKGCNPTLPCPLPQGATSSHRVPLLLGYRNLLGISPVQMGVPCTCCPEQCSFHESTTHIPYTLISMLTCYAQFAALLAVPRQWNCSRLVPRGTYNCQALGVLAMRERIQNQNRHHHCILMRLKKPSAAQIRVPCQVGFVAVQQRGAVLCLQAASRDGAVDGGGDGVRHVRRLHGQVKG